MSPTTLRNARIVFFITLVLTLVTMSFAQPSFAEGFRNVLCEDGTNCITLSAFLLKILNALVFILFPVVVIMIVYTGLLFVVAQGNESKITQARTALMWTIVGALVLLGAKALAMLICETVNDLDPATALSCS